MLLQRSIKKERKPKNKRCDTLGRYGRDHTNEVKSIRKDVSRLNAKLNEVASNRPKTTEYVKTKQTNMNIERNQKIIIAVGITIILMLLFL